MSQIKTLNGVQYTLPQYNDTAWGANTGNVLTQYLAAIADVTLQLSGGSFTLTADVDFGANFGLKALFLKSETANPASAGVVRLAKTDAIKWRNNANAADIALAIDGSDNLQYSATKVLLSGAVVNADINASAAIAYSKLALTGSIVNADVNASAAIAYTKLALSASIVNADIAIGAAIAYSKLALTGAILNADLAGSIAYSKLALTGAILNADLAGSIAVNKLVALGTSKALATDGSGFLAVSSTTAAELAFVSGVTSAIQTQINAKQATLTVGQLPGTATNDNASAGNVGEFIDSSISSLTSTGSTGVFANLTSISLTAGDWDVSGNIIFSLGTATGITNGAIALSAFSGNTTTDHVAGKNAYGSSSYPTATQDASIGTIPCWRVSIVSTTTIFLKGAITYSGGAPKFYGYISARRRR